MNMTSPDFSPLARQYAQSRPGYPAELFAFLAAQAVHHDAAWDCATGNGQAAFDLARHFQRVIATDLSAEQIRHAIPHARIEYRVAGAEQSGLAGRSVDLVTVASALHWFNLERFFAEVQRVVRPGGVLAAWTYHVGHVAPPFNQVFARFYYDILSPYFAAGARLVDQRYETITLPGQPLEAPAFEVSADWNLDQMFAFINSWSGTQRYRTQRGEDPVALITEELRQIWGERQQLHTVRWPLYLRLARL